MTGTQRASSDVYGYSDLLRPDEWSLVRRVRDFLESSVRPIAAECWEHARFPRELLPALAELRIVGLSYPIADRPVARRLCSGFLSLEIARVDTSLATFVGVQSGLAMGTIHQCGSAEQRERWLPAMRELSLIGAFALTEPLAGSDVARGLRTTARRDLGGWVLDGAKRWIGNGTFADLVIIWARDVADGEVKGFVVERGTPGFTSRKMEGKIALRSIENADIELHGCRVPAANKLAGANSFRDTAAVLQQTRGGVAWNAVGAMMGAYELAVDYAASREQFGKPIGSFQLIQQLLARMLENVTASLGMAVRVAQLQQDGVCRDEQTALAKSFCTTRLRETVAMGGNSSAATASWPRTG